MKSPNARPRHSDPERLRLSRARPRAAPLPRPGPRSLPESAGLFRNHHEAILMRQWVRNAAPSRAAGVRAAPGGSTCPRPGGHPRGSGSRNSGRQEMNGDPRGGGATGPGAPEDEGLGKARTPHPGPQSEARPGRPLPGGAERTRRVPGRGPGRAPPGFSPPRCHVPPALRLRDGPAPRSGYAGPGHIGLARGRPARDRTRGRASRPRADPPPGLESQRLCSRPPGPARSSPSPPLASAPV